MIEFVDRAREDRRLVILRTLALDGDYRLNERLLSVSLESMCYDLSIDLLRAELVWLAEQDLVTLQEHGSIRIISLTPRGLDVAAGRARAYGVARPLPGDQHL